MGVPGRRVKVLYFVSSFEQGGAERQVAELVAGLDLARYEPHLAVCNPADQLGYDLPFVTRTDLRSPQGPEPATLLRLARVLRQVRPDVLHSYLGHQNLYGRLAVRMTGIGKAVGSVRCTRLPAQAIRHERLTHRLTDALIVNSVGIREELVRRARVRADRIDVVENGVDTRRFRPPSAEERRTARERFGMTGTTLVVPGRISSQKNQIALVAALALLRARGQLPPDVRVIFAGRQEAHTRYGTYLRAAIALTRTGDLVRFAGVVREVEELLGAADAMVLPSIFEGLPNVVLESLACGTPAIVSPGANVDDLVCDAETGLAMEGAGPHAIAGSLARFFALPEEERRRMGLRGRETALARFTVARMVRRTCAVYERVLGREPA